VTPEGRVLARVVRYLKQRRARGEPVFFVKLHGGPMQRAGLPDLLVIHRGRVLGIEVKRPGRRATAIQAHTMAEMRAAGAQVIVATCVADVVQAMEGSHDARQTD